jgi:hypothetical protein
MAQSPAETPPERRHGLQDLDQSDSTNNYIFTDDEGSVESPLVPRDQRQPDGGGLYASLSSRYKSFGSDSDSQSSASANKSPATWTAYNQSKGREFARKMISDAKEGKVSRKAPLDDASDTDNDSDLERAPSYGRHKAAGRSASSSSLLGMLGSASRRGRGLFVTSKSASRSAVDRRNNDFYDWEVQAAPRSLLSSSRNLRGDLSGQTPSVGTASTSIRSNLSTRSVTSSVVASIIKEQRQRDKKVFRNAAAVCSDGLDCRLTADHVATMLQLGDDGDQLLSNLRGKSGAVEMEEPYAFYRGFPYLHLEGDVWIPHYEEYVVRTVDAFGRFLQKRTKAQRSGAS